MCLSPLKESLKRHLRSSPERGIGTNGPTNAGLGVGVGFAGVVLVVDEVFDVVLVIKVEGTTW